MENKENLEKEEIKTESTAEKPEKTEKKAKKSSRNPFRSKKFRKGSLSVLFTVMFVAAVVLVNIIANLLADRFDVSVDLTTDSIYSVEDSTLERLSKIDSKVNITITTPEADFEAYGSYFKQTNEVAKKIADSNANFSLGYIDLLANPNFMAKFEEELSDAMIVVESEATGRSRVIPTTDYLLYYVDGEQVDTSTASMYMNYYGITPEIRSAAEEQLLSAIVSVTNVNPKTIAFTTGYGEDENKVLKELAEKNAYIVETLNIDLVEEISADIDFIVISAPDDDYSLEALTKLDKWLDNGGNYGKNVIYCASVGQESTPNIDMYLSEWGISVGNGVIYQTDTNYGYASYGSAYGQLLSVADTEYLDNMTVSSYAQYFGNYVRPVNILWEEYSNYENIPLITTYGETSVIIPFDAPENWSLDDATDTGMFNAAVEASKVLFRETTPVFSKLIVLGSELMLYDSYLTTTNYTNGEFALSLFNTNNEQETISIAPKNFTMSTFEVVPAVTNPIAIVFSIVLPIVIVAAGIVVWVRRRRK